MLNMRLWTRATVLTAALAAFGTGMEMTVVDKPVTASVPVPSAARRAEAIILRLIDVTVPGSVPVRIDIFSELPSASTHTSVESANFVGYITSLPSLNAVANPKRGFIVQVAGPAARRMRDLRTVRLTFVPGASIAEGGFKIGSMRIEPAAPDH